MIRLRRKKHTKKSTKPKPKPKDKGFTLIELIIVIVILGILVAVAVPKYMDARTDAEEAVASGIIAAIQSTDVNLFTAYQLRNVDYADADVSGGVTLTGATITMAAGKGTITMPSKKTYTFTYVAHDKNSPGTYTKGW